MLTHVDTSELKNSNIFICDFCDFKCCKKSLWDKHVLTRKHKNVDKMLTNVDTSEIKSSKTYICDCGKIYNHRQSLCVHRKKCKNTINIDNINDMSEPSKSQISLDEHIDLRDKNVILQLLEQNKEFKDLLAEQNKLIFDLCNKQSCQYNNSNNNINSHNKAFNLHFFLNETCKNAMNMSDFVDSLQFQLSDLESIGDLGYVDGISKIIIKSLKALDESERPIHCTDKKRETFYIKDKDKWEKEDENKSRLRQTINYVANENTLLIPQWKAKHSDYKDSFSENSDKYNNMIIEVLGGDNSSHVNEEKIIRKIAKEVMIDK